MKRPLPPPTARQLGCLVAAAVGELLVAAGLVLKAVASGAGHYLRHKEASER